MQDISPSEIERMLYKGIPKKGMTEWFMEKKLLHLVRYFVKGKTVEQTSNELGIHLPYVRSLYVNLERIRKEYNIF